MPTATSPGFVFTGVTVSGCVFVCVCVVLVFPELGSLLGERRY